MARKTKAQRVEEALRKDGVLHQFVCHLGGREVKAACGQHVLHEQVRYSLSYYVASPGWEGKICPQCAAKAR
jgi:hypothetical protein